MSRLAVWTLAAALAAPLALAQPATPAQRAGVANPQGMATLHLQTRLGSFRLIDGEGRVEMTFRGTVLVNNLQGTVVPGPGVRREHQTSVRQLFHGRGTIVITGKWRAVQWFGGDMRATWFGRGLARVMGEFDKDLNTGFYWYDDPTDRNYWFANSATTLTLPQQSYANLTKKPRRRNP